MDQQTERRRHSAAHVLAMAAQRVFPGTRLGIGPVTNEGFYHDFEFPQPISWNDIKQLESEMNLIIQEDLPFKRMLVPRDQAFDILMTRGQIYKSELLQELYDPEISFFKTGETFVDLCRGPHVESTNEIGAIKLLSLEETNWKNDDSRPKMQRIRGVVFATPQELNSFLNRQQEIQTRDFRRYIQDLNLGILQDDAVFFSPTGTLIHHTIRRRIQRILRNAGFEEVMTPLTTESDSQLDHLDHLFSSKNRSYRSLPYRIFTINRTPLPKPMVIFDKHLDVSTEVVAKTYFAPQDQAAQIKHVLKHVIQLCNGLSLRPHAEIHASDMELEQLQQVAEVLHQNGVSQTQIIDATTPKDHLMITFIVKDTLQRSWKLIFVTAAVKDREYVATDGEFASSNSISIELSLDKILAYYLEDKEGGVPFWAAAHQAAIIPISEQQEHYAAHIEALFRKNGLRCTIDNRPETMQARIRDAEVAKAPIILVIGEKEQAARAVSVRLRNKKELGLISEDTLLETLQSYISSLE